MSKSNPKNYKGDVNELLLALRNERLGIEPEKITLKIERDKVSEQTEQPEPDHLIYDEAEKLLQQGICVIPILKGNKNPSLPEWKKYEDTRPTEEELVEWFWESDNQIAIVTGLVSGGYFVIDFDGVNWDRAFDEFCNQFPEFSDTLTVVTGSGKAHLYGVCPEMERSLTRVTTGKRQNQVSKKWCGSLYPDEDLLDGKPTEIELRCNGCYVLCPPSIHPDTGREYKYGDGPDVPIQISKERLNEIKEWIESKRNPEQEEQDNNQSDEKDEKKGKEKNESTFGNHVRGISIQDIAKKLGMQLDSSLHGNCPTGHPSEGEKCFSIDTKTNKWSCFSCGLMEQDGIKLVEIVKKLTPIEAVKWLELEFKINQGTKSAQEILDALPTFNDLDPDKKIEWKVEGLIPGKAITSIFGISGIGKTHLIYLMGKCVIRGNDFFGLKTEQAPVYYLDYENPEDVRCHVVKICGGSAVKMWALDSPVGSPPKLDKKGWEILKEFPPGLIIVDSFRACQLKNTTEDTDAAFIMDRLKQLWACGHTIIIILHTLKGEARKWKGNQVVMDLSDNCLALYQVREIGSDEEIEDEGDELNSPKLLYFGNLKNEKSRYGKQRIYVRYDPKSGITKAESPTKQILKEIQSKFYEWQDAREKELERKLTMDDSPNTEQFAELIKGWGFNGPRKLIKMGLEQGRWDRDKNDGKKGKPAYFFPVQSIKNSRRTLKTEMGDLFPSSESDD